MSKVVTLPPASVPGPDGRFAGGWWHEDIESGRAICDLCPRACNLRPGDRGFCFVRENHDGAMVLNTFGRSTGFCIDPIEKKPLNHFYPGTSVLSFGTAGCNLGCKFCQNWDISKSREVERLSEQATPEAIATAAHTLGCKSVAFTYNDPIVWAEYAIETAKACRAEGVKTVAVTAGYITPEARGPFFEFMDAANVDLKGFTEEFYRHVTYSHLQPVLDTLAWLKKETDVWFEVTNLVIPQENDNEDDIRRMCGWMLEHCGDQVPLHFTAFHPDFRMTDRPNTPHETLLRAFEIARTEGLKHVYTGNVNDVVHQSSYCPHCHALVIERNWYELGKYQLRGDRCQSCGGSVSGRFDESPGTWGRKRVPIDISRTARPTVPQIVTIAQPPRPLMPATIDDTPQTFTSTRLDLTDDQRAQILSAAAQFVVGTLSGRPVSLADPTLAGTANLPVEGAYVTLKRHGQLRACCGTLGASRPLQNALFDAARTTAKDDHRLPPISLSELPYLDLSVNLLFGFETLAVQGRERLSAVEAGRHGLRIQRGESVGLLLPGVAVEKGWDSESFLRHVCLKAGLPTTAWEDDDTRLSTFESVEFGGSFDPNALEAFGPLVSRRLDPAQLGQVANHARGNVLALLQGMTPNYYIPGLHDGTVSGLVLTLGLPAPEEPIHLLQLSLRPGIPFQATLFALCEAAAKSIARRGALPRSLRVGVTILTDPSMQGTAAHPDLRGLDTNQRALLLLEQNKTALVFQPNSSDEVVLATARETLDVLNPERSGLFGLDAQSTERSIVFRSSPRAEVTVAKIRPSAVAGRFYPADPAELGKLVDQLIGTSERLPESWPAAMVPHAGLVYSGKVVASVFNRLEIPEAVIVIGPKHTRNGVDWAVDPHESWSIPGATLSGDPGLARRLADSIRGLRLDAAAHREEHAIEVELPFLAHLAPTTRVVGLAIGGGDWEHCRQFAHGLADVLRVLPTQPLLLISSDMNHFANDRETRLLDETALTAMSHLDPERLLATVNEHNISMCGVLPAVIVMETLRLLGGLTTCERVNYATSADVTGNPNRVVGYAGVLLR